MNTQTFYKQVGNAIADYLYQELKLRPGEHYRFATVTNGPRVLALGLDLNPTYAKKIMAMGEALSMAARLDKNAHIRIERGNRGTLCLEIPKPQALWFNVSVSHLPPRRGLLASVGLDSDKRPAVVNFGSALTPHALLAGTTGSGKTNCLKLLAYDLASQNGPDAVSLVLIDTCKRGANWRPFVNLPHLAHSIITAEDVALRALSWTVAEIDRRATSGRTKPHVFIGVDEAQDLLEQEPFVKAIGDIAATGREFGIHLLAAMQNPTARQLGDTSIKRNLSCRLVGKVDSATAAVVATGQANSGAELLTGAGDMLLVQPDGIRRLTAALLTTRDTDRLPRAESVPNLDLAQYEDVDHVVEQADNESKADPLNPRHVAVALVAEKGITWLAQRLRIGSAKARRVLEFANDLRDELIEMGCYTTIPPYQQGIDSDEKEPKESISGMVVCQYGEE